MTSPDGLADLLAPFAGNPGGAGIISDFDGTLSQIVLDAPSARPLDGVPEVLVALGRRYRRVGVVSGRPASFLLDRLCVDGRPPDGLSISGLYGLERAEGVEVHVHPAALHWVDAVEAVACAADVEAPSGVWVERKGLAVTLHVRSAPEQAGWAESFARTHAAVSGLAVHPGRMSFELRPPVEVDKGTVVAEMLDGLHVACFLGDDLGDLPAFDALDRFRAAGGTALKVGVRSREAPAELVARADLLVDGPDGALGLLRRLLELAAPQGRAEART